MFELNKIKYINEGNQNLAVSINSNDAHYIGKVLRLTKIETEKLETQNLAKLEADIDFQYKFYKDILSALIPEANLPKIDIVELNSELLQQINDQIESYRPESRKDKVINYKLSRCLLMDNLIFEGGLSFEVKPKWGFLNHNQLVASSNEYCRYCKHKLCKEDHYSNYCPINLYNNIDLQKSIDDLLDSVKLDCGFKNLKFFELNKILNFNEVLDEWSKLIELEDKTILETSLKAILSQIFENTKIFNLLQNLQSKLDPIGIRKIYELLIQTEIVDLKVLKDKLTNTQYILECVNYFLNECPIISKDLISNDVEFCYKLTVAYIISNTFKDCSLIFNLSLFNTGSDNECIEFELNDKIIKFNLEIGVVDLDLKNVSKLKHWYDLEVWINEEFERMLDEGLVNITKCSSLLKN
ncbi:hypothetical protein CONCODRAFT_4836 [Conidiobolus coronatus NRRL 28638]|uniref:Inositol-pentakisphosphate 2-kinase n=1 Tax=Conidiobolus coronatus (strain ATCC 28846 / CBS 209.66 / NRRL 28638) TaxID=796925 RepID=A0A137PBQ4_CONC2|nr:hypothetical protein CONCODRAFT_4836 [Conidiobolus coronatus NRRL 28638]|eukprot:KXN72392.1 hypothetical protein CONCODRAFT_4836 [Conidiobolus coronatus NRRL 28638]